MTALRATLALVFLAMPAATPASGFDASATEACLVAAPTNLASCIGHAADACMVETPGGETTVGMGACLLAELAWWSARLAEAQAGVLAQAEAGDAAMRGTGATVPSQAGAFYEMLEAWADWRDAACEWERSQWGGGSGAGAATAACRMRITGEQALALEGWLAERARR